MQFKSTLLLAGLAAANPIQSLEERQSGCAKVHIFGARETTVGPGFGSSGTVVNLIKNAYPGATTEAITYPACGGQSSCGGVSYENSQQQGTKAVVSAVQAKHSACPSTQIVLVGYSQGGQIMDNAMCGGGVAQLTGDAFNAVKAAIFMGDPRFRAGQPYQVGTCKAQGFAAYPAGFTCAAASKVKSYCDAADPYCCNGNSAATHQGYGSEYGQQALAFVKTLVTA